MQPWSQRSPSFLESRRCHLQGVFRHGNREDLSLYLGQSLSSHSSWLVRIGIPQASRVVGRSATTSPESLPFLGNNKQLTPRKGHKDRVCFCMLSDAIPSSCALKPGRLVGPWARRPKMVHRQGLPAVLGLCVLA